MPSFLNVTPYVNSVWNCAYNSLSYANATLSTLSSGAELVLAKALAQTLRNSRDAIDANQLGIAAANGYLVLGPTLAVPCGLPASTLAYIQNRLYALQSFAIALQNLQPAPVATPSNSLSTGNPAMPDPLLLEYMVGFSAEGLPGGISASTFAIYAQNEADAWLAYAAALQGVVSNQAIDEMNYMAAASQTVATAVANVSISPNASLVSAWNGMVSLPAIARYASSDATDPTSSGSQQTAVIKNIVGQSLYNTYVLVVNLSQAIPSVVNTVTVRNNDSLMAIAARTLGDYTQWQSIAQANNLIPPYIAPVSAPGVAGWGQNIYLPTSSGTATTVPPAAYEATFLGTDFWYGPINQDMLPWTGDILTISGNQNLAFSLGRRLQTTLGTLLFHSDFGSRIPPEVGGIVTQDTSGQLGAFAESALASDNRVAQVLSVNVTVLASYALNIAGTVLPKGLTGNYSISVNANLSPIVAGLT